LVEPRKGIGWRRQRRPKIKGDPGRSQGLPVGAGHLALNALSSRNTTGVRIGPASILQCLILCGTETKAQGCVENIIRGSGGGRGDFGRG
jgi:hypothetical protein